MKKVKYCSLPIFGLLKVTKMLDRCEVVTSGPTKKAHKYKAKARNSEKAHTQGRSLGSCHFSMKKVKHCSLPIFGLLKVTKMLDRCEVVTSGPTKKAHKYKAKARNFENAHTQGRSLGSCHFLARPGGRRKCRWGHF